MAGERLMIGAFATVPIQGQGFSRHRSQRRKGSVTQLRRAQLWQILDNYRVLRLKKPNVPYISNFY